jgi:AraC-like DNA-binding protein
MPASIFHSVSKGAWIEQIGSPKTKLRVRLGQVPGRFRTPPEWDTRPRCLAEHLIHFFAQESARAEVAGDTFPCPRGSCCWVAAGTTFRFFSDRSPLIWRFRFSVTDGKRKSQLTPDQPYYFLPHTHGMAEIIHPILSELAHPDKWQVPALRAWLVQLSLLFFRPSIGPEPRTLTAAQQTAIAALLENARPDKWIQPRDMASAAGLSLDYFSRVFHRTHGVAPREWLVRERLAYAVVLLQETPLRVGEIAQRLGYANPHLFSRQFSAQIGRSPRSYRL